MDPENQAELASVAPGISALGSAQPLAAVGAVARHPRLTGGGGMIDLDGLPTILTRAVHARSRSKNCPN
jgi:hypothetical protein